MGFLSSLFQKKSVSSDMLRCKSCGHTQKKGAWEAAMDEKAKAMGKAGFINFGQKPECLKCGKPKLKPA